MAHISRIDQFQTGVYIFNKRNGVTRYAYIFDDGNSKLLKFSKSITLAETFPIDYAEILVQLTLKGYEGTLTGMIRPELIKLDIPEKIKIFIPM